MARRNDNSDRQLMRKFGRFLCLSIVISFLAWCLPAVASDKAAWKTIEKLQATINPKDPLPALQKLGSQCHNDDLAACYVIDKHLVDFPPPSLKTTHERAEFVMNGLLLIANLCGKKYVPACITSATASYELGLKSQAGSAAKIACDANTNEDSGAGCSLLGLVLMDAGDRVEANDAWERGCKLKKSASSCFSLATARAGAGQIEEGKSLFELACKFGMGEACLRLSFIEKGLGNEEGSGRYYQKARALFRTECGKGNDDSCKRLVEGTNSEKHSE